MITHVVNYSGSAAEVGSVEHSEFMALDIPSMEAVMLKLPQQPAPVVHRFGPGIYIREVFLPAGTFAIGHKQTTEHMNVVLKGKVMMADGTVLTAPMIFVGKPGRKAGFIEEDTVWLNIYATDETDVEKLEAMFLEKSEVFKEHAKPMNDAEARADFPRMLDDMGVTADLVSAQSENESDQIPMPHGAYSFQIGPSPIHGRGVFACSSIPEGEWIGPARLCGKRTPLGRFVNHSPTPNALMVNMGGDVALVASRAISGQRGGMLGEEITVDYRQARMEALKCQA